MTAIDVFFYAFSIGFVILVIVISFTSYHIIKTLQGIKVVIEDVRDTTRDVRTVKNTVKLGVFQIASMALRLFMKKGGEKYAH